MDTWINWLVLTLLRTPLGAIGECGMASLAIVSDLDELENRAVAYGLVATMLSRSSIAQPRPTATPHSDWQASRPDARPFVLSLTTSIAPKRILRRGSRATTSCYVSRRLDRRRMLCLHMSTDTLLGLADSIDSLTISASTSYPPRTQAREHQLEEFRMTA